MGSIENKQHYLKQMNSRHRMVIRNSDFKVMAPLPDDFGFTVGSEFSSPFDAGSMSESWQKAFAVAGISQKLGLRMRNMFSNPEPTELSFQLDFDAYYDAFDEVFAPMAQLTLMSLGRTVTWEHAKNKIQELMDKGGAVTQAAFSNFTNDDGDGAEIDLNLETSDSTDEVGGRLMDLIGIIESPKKVTIQFGDIMRWPNCYLKSVALTFSNTLDSNGYPMSGKASVTFIPENYPIFDDMINVFGNGIIGE